MLVVGDQHSSNTQKLFEICLQECNNTHFVETVQDLDALWFEDAKRVGITAGASTPHKIIEEVQTYVREF
jgi:4-hydroxy-3-methylbut-2-enyl diphosphate reductase